MARLVVENLAKIFKNPAGQEIRAVQNVNLAIEGGELMVLVGPSGCGKTTLLRLIAGLEDITAGTVSIDGRVVNEVEPKDRNVEMVFQSPALYPHMTAYENMAFGLRLRKLDGAEVGRRVREASAMLGIENCLNRIPKDLSGGERQRVALGRAIVRQPKALLLDEPLSNLDAPLRGRMRLELKRLHARLGATMLHVTHDQFEAMAMGDRIAIMENGVLQQIAEPTVIYDRPANLFVAGFIGSPPMNFFQGNCVKRDGGIFFEEKAPAGFALRLDDETASRIAAWLGKRVVLGIRPENMEEGASQPCIQAIAEAVEATGPEMLVHASTGAHGFIAKFPARSRIAPSQKISVAIEMRGACFFDPDTEKAIG
jgi:multiple sugar transport system ATP-binding protein